MGGVSLTFFFYHFRAHLKQERVGRQLLPNPRVGRTDRGPLTLYLQLREEHL